MRTPHILGALALAALAAVAVIAIPAVAQSPATFTFKELEKGSTFKIVDVAPKAKGERSPPGVGDTLTFTNPLSGPAGKLSADCLVTKSGKKFEAVVVLCDGTYAFKAGTVYVSALTKLTGHTVGAVVGGTGDYASAEGTFESRDVKGGSTTTISLLP
jgi:hypothetical protein